MVTGARRLRRERSWLVAGQTRGHTCHRISPLLSHWHDGFEQGRGTRQTCSAIY